MAKMIAENVLPTPGAVIYATTFMAINSVTQVQNPVVVANVPMPANSKLKVEEIEITATGQVLNGSKVQSVSGDFAGGIKLKSADGNKWLIQVSNTGQLSAIKLT